MVLLHPLSILVIGVSMLVRKALFRGLVIKGVLTIASSAAFAADVYYSRIQLITLQQNVWI